MSGTDRTLLERPDSQSLNRSPNVTQLPGDFSRLERGQEVDWPAGG